MPRCVLLSILLLLIFPVDSFAQKTRAEFQAFCQRNRNTETSGEESLYPAQFPTAWRCMNGSVYICEMGASGRGCLKAGFNFSPGKGEQAWCRENPNSDFIPGAYLSSAAISWRCRGSQPVIVETEGLDERGYVKRAWRKVGP